MSLLLNVMVVEWNPREPTFEFEEAAFARRNRKKEVVNEVIRLMKTRREQHKQIKRSLVVW